MKRVQRLLAVIVVMLCLGSVSQSISWAQSSYGPTGLFVHPSAFLTPPNRFSLYASTFSQDTARGRVDWAPAVSLSYGLSNHLEVGGLFVRNSGSRISDANHGGGYVKIGFLGDSAAHPALSLVATYLHGEPLESTVSGVVSHNFLRDGKKVLTANIGVKYGRSGTTPTVQDDVGGFLGLEIPVGSGISLAGDVGTQFSFERSVPHGYGVIWRGTSGASVRIGLINLGGGGPDKFFIGVGYPLGGVR